jgi:hypothetical protein
MTKIPKNPHLDSFEKRKQTFIDKGWDYRIPVSVEELSEAGFYYTGVNDEVECFYCLGGVYEWATEYAPLLSHEKYYPNCHHLKLMRRQENNCDCLTCGHNGNGNQTFNQIQLKKLILKF